MMPEMKLEERVEALEREVAKLKQQATLREQRKSWRNTIGWFANDPEFEQILALGHAIRQEDREANGR